MTQFSASAEHLYTNFVLRDILAKVIPGLILIAGLIMGAFSLSLREVIRVISEQPTVVIVLLFLISWTGGFVVQEIGTWLRLLGSESPSTEARKQHVELLGRTMAKLNPAQLQRIERMVVIKEASGNLAVALFLGAILWLLSFIPFQDSGDSHAWWHYIKPVSLFLVVLAALFARHWRATRIAQSCR